MMEIILRTSGLATLKDQATLFVLSALEEISQLPAVVHAFEKASLPKVQNADLPLVMFYTSLFACALFNHTNCIL